MESSLSTNSKRPGGREETEEPGQKRVKTEDEEYETDYEEIRLQEDTKNRKDEESHFLHLFTMVLNFIITIKDVQEESIAEGIKRIKSSFNVPSGSSFQFLGIDFTKWENLCGYLYRYGSHGAGFARCRILNALRNCEGLRFALNKSDLRIICLGSGPGNDAVGVCSALAEFQFPNNLNITVVDKFKEWSLCVKLAEILIQERNFGKVSELFQRTNVNLAFIPVDLPGNETSNKEYFQILAEADVIVMSKLMSIITDDGVKKSIIKSLYKNMKREAVILLNDTFEVKIWSNFDSLYSWGYNEEDIYKSSASAEGRFLSDDSVPSKLPITVLRKIYYQYVLPK